MTHSAADRPTHRSGRMPIIRRKAVVLGLLGTVALASATVASPAAAAPSAPAISRPIVDFPVSELGSRHRAWSANGDPGSSDRFSPPIPIVVVRPFQRPPTRFGAGHRGVDLAAGPGTAIRAAGSGIVIFAGPLAGRGVISIEHLGGLRTTYEPVRAVVRAGEEVRRGQPIGSLEAGGSADSPQDGHGGSGAGHCAPAACLHLGARLPNGTYLDPLSLFGAWQVRLKPWAGLD